MQRWHQTIAEPLIAYTKEPVGSCKSKNLSAAISGIGTLLEEEQNLPAREMAAGYTLTAADVAAIQGCPAIAHDLYHLVINTYTGGAYAAYRQRAEIGLDDLRAARP